MPPRLAVAGGSCRPVAGQCVWEAVLRGVPPEDRRRRRPRRDTPTSRECKKNKKNGVQAVARGDEWEHGVEPMHIRHSPHRWPDAPHHRPFPPNSRNLEIRVSNGKVTTTGRSWDFDGDLSSTAQSADRRLSRWVSSSRSTTALLGTGVRLRGHPPLPPPRHRVGYSTHSRLATVHSRRGAVSPGSGICPDAGRCPRCPRLPIPPRPSQSPR